MGFAALHAHDHYSLLDGYAPPEKHVELAKKQGYSALAQTNHGNLFGSIDFAKACKKHEFKGLIGCEIYLSLFDRREKTAENHRSDLDALHLTLLVQNEVGWRNLSEIVSDAYEVGSYYKANRTDREFLAAHSEGLICLSGCLSGPVSKLLMMQRGNDAVKMAGWFKEVFGDRYYMELMPPDFEEQATCDKYLQEVARRVGLKTVMTFDSHYPCASDAVAEDLLLAIQTGDMVDAKERRLKLPTSNFYLRTPDEIAELRREFSKAVDTTIEVSDRCNFVLDYETLRLPKAIVPEGKSADSWMRELIEEGWYRRAKLINRHRREKNIPMSTYKARLEHELRVINKLGYRDYFLVLSDIVRWAKDSGIPVGCARGSGSASLTAFLMRITDVDPVRFDLPFERFINEERSDMPDLDLDFGSREHGQVMAYIKERYGEQNVARIASFSKLKGRSGITDVMRSFGEDLKAQKRVSKLVAQSGRIDINLQRAMEMNPALKEELDAMPVVRDLVVALEGSPRSVGLHAAGVVITPVPVRQIYPTFCTHPDSKKKAERVTAVQASHKMIERMMLKMDILSIDTLNALRWATESIKEHDGREIDLLDIPYDDRKTYDMLQAGRSTGVFQFESQLMIQLLRDIRPRNVEELALVNAVARPGAMDHAPELAARRRGEVEWNDYFPELHEILRSTCSILVFQEQLIRSCMAIAGMTWTEADSIRRSCSKKSYEEMAKCKTPFIERSLANGHDADELESFWQIIEKFAEYAFPLGHSVSYSMIANQTAFLKAHYPVDFFAGLLTAYAGNKDDLRHYVQAARDFGVELLDLDINKSSVAFKREGNAIRWGFCGLQGFGESGLRALERVRKGFDEYEEFGMYLSKLPENGHEKPEKSEEEDDVQTVIIDFNTEDLNDIALEALKVAIQKRAGGGNELVLRVPHEGSHVWLTTPLSVNFKAVQQLVEKFFPGKAQVICKSSGECAELRESVSSSSQA